MASITEIKNREKHLAVRTQCVNAVEELAENIFFLQEVHRNLGQGGAKLSSWLRGPAQFPNLHRKL